MIDSILPSHWTAQIQRGSYFHLYWSLMYTQPRLHTGGSNSSNFVMASLELIAELIENPIGIDADDPPLEKMSENIRVHVAKIIASIIE